MVLPVIAAAAAEGAVASSAAAGAAGGAAASAGASGVAASGAASAEGATAARGQLLANRQAAKQAANGQMNSVSAPQSNSRVVDAESQLDDWSRFKSEQQRMRVDGQRDEGEEEGGQMSGQSNDPVSRLKQGAKQAEAAVYGALDNPMVTKRASDAVTAAIQATGFTSLTMVDFLLGIFVATPATIIQMLVTFGIITSPPEGTKAKIAYDIADYHLFDDATGFPKLGGGVLILLYASVLLIIVLAIFIFLLAMIDLIPGVDIMGLDIMDGVRAVVGSTATQTPTP